MRWLGLALVLAAPGCNARRGLDVPARGVESVDVLVPDRPGREQQIARTSDAAAIGPFLGALREARETGDHKCASTARVVIRPRQGPPVDVEVLPGHDDRFYEYRHDGRIDRTPRPGMLVALGRLGLSDPPLR